eukprot:327348-Rhodomonas_salina.2
MPQPLYCRARRARRRRGYHLALHNREKARAVHLPFLVDLCPAARAVSPAHCLPRAGLRQGSAAHQVLALRDRVKVFFADVDAGLEGQLPQPLLQLLVRQPPALVGVERVVQVVDLLVKVLGRREGRERLDHLLPPPPHLTHRKQMQIRRGACGTNRVERALRGVRERCASRGLTMILSVLFRDFSASTDEMNSSSSTASTARSVSASYSISDATLVPDIV